MGKRKKCLKSKFGSHQFMVNPPEVNPPKTWNRKGVTNFGSTKINEEIRKVKRVYHLERRFLF